MTHTEYYPDGFREVGLIKPVETVPISPPRLLSFCGPDGEVGWLDWVDGKLTFGGDLAESARIFFEYFKPLVEAYFGTVGQGERAESGYVVPLGSPIRPEMRPGDEADGQS